MTKEELQKRVDARKQEIVDSENKLSNFKEKVTDFFNDIKKRSTIYALIKNLPLWKELEELVDGDSDAH